MPKSGICFVPPELQQVLENLPDEEPRSKLEPFKPFILRWRRQGRSYRKIQQILRDECHTDVAFETLRSFVKRRSRPRKAQPDLEIEPAIPQPAARSTAAVPTGAQKPLRSAEEIAALRASFDKPLFPEERQPLFVRRPGPIRNLNNER